VAARLDWLQRDLAAAEWRQPSDGNAEIGPITGWIWRDFRRSFATALGEAGIREHGGTITADGRRVPEARAVYTRGPYRRQQHQDDECGAACRRIIWSKCTRDSNALIMRVAASWNILLATWSSK
jgi:hypothetical protein